MQFEYGMVKMVWMVGNCQQIPRLPATTNQWVTYLSSTDLLARADTKPKHYSQCGGTSGHDMLVVVGANADTGSNKERC